MLAQFAAPRSDAIRQDANTNGMAFATVVCGTLLHSAAADAAAQEGGERGLLASDLFPHLRRMANPVEGECA
jgi:NAD(P)H-hydrate repair Nnr-like enzyme with NAD(P)H-hydrate dehydratase domain